MAAKFVKDAYNFYGFSPAEYLETQKGYRNYSYPARLENGQYVNLILYKDEPEVLSKIKNANSVSSYLTSRELLVRHPIDPRILKIAFNNHTRYASIYTYVLGQTIPWDAYTSKHIKLLGTQMGRMHILLKQYEGSLPPIEIEYQHIIRRMRKYFSEPGVQDALEQKLGLKVDINVLNYYSSVLHLCGQLPDRQALHMDFVRSNILFNDNSYKNVVFAGILDFEKASYGHPVFDIARTLAFLYVDCGYKSKDQILKKFLISGYIRTANAAFTNIVLVKEKYRIDLLNTLSEFFLFYDFYKFLKHNPYEFLDQNIHYLRTKEMLVEYSVIKQRMVKT